MTAARSLGNLGNQSTLSIDTINTRVGVDSTSPDQTLAVGAAISMYGSTGIVSATKFSGGWDGTLSVTDTTESTSSTTGALIVSGGVGIAKSLFVAGNISAGGTVTYEDVTNQDVIGLSTFRSGVQFGAAGIGGTIDGVGNAIISGVTTLSGDIRVPDDKKLHFGNIGGANGDLQLWHDAGQHSYIRDQGSGDLRIYGSAVDIRDNAGTASVARFTDNSVHLAGITTVGILTAYDSIKVGSGVTIGSGNSVNVGIGTTATILNVSNSTTQNSFAGILKEKCSIQSANVTGDTIDLAQGNLFYYTTNGSGATTAAIIYNGGNNVSGFMTTGDAITVSLITKPNNSEYINQVTIDGAAVTEEWNGGSAPSSANSSGFDLYTFNIVRVDQTGTPNTDYLVLGTVSNFA